jgi:methylthioribose-1-phosphate isomerase
MEVKWEGIRSISGTSWKMRTIDWEDGAVTLIDQTGLPKEERVLKCSTVDELVDAIRNLRVRGAPALCAAGAFGVALAAKNGEDIENAAEILKKTRPTAINLSYGIDRVLEKASNGKTTEEIREFTLEEAKRIAEEDIEVNKKIGEHGAKLLEDGDVVLTHCNAGRMACIDWGTALGVIRTAIEQGKEIKVVACETRPLNQGSRITTWELLRDNIPVMLIVDSAAGYLMKKGMVDKVIVGADRITRNAVINKIGTYSLSILAKEHGIPFYVAAPLSTFDLEKEEKDVEIEERVPNELIYIGREQIAPLDVDVYNPAFDATPIELVTAIITEKGISESQSL